VATVATCQVRCGGRLHRIELDEGGCLHFWNHPRGFSRREDMLVELGGAGCRCWEVLRLWRAACTTGLRADLPKDLSKEVARIAAYRKHQSRRAERRNGQPPTFHGRMGQRAANTASRAMRSADYHEGGSRWVENDGGCSVEVDWSVDRGSASATVEKVWHEKKPWSAKRVTWNLKLQPARFLVAQHRLGRHVLERGERRVVLEILRDHAERSYHARYKIPANTLVVRAVRQGRGYDVYDCVALLRPPKAGEKHWRLTRWLD
jgi:hypothetical protein